MQNGTGEVQLETTATAKTRKPKGTVTRNPTTVAIAKISNILDSLEPEQSSRVLAFINAEYTAE